MTTHYYDKKDLKDFPNIGEFSPQLGDDFFNYFSKATAGGALSEREKTLIALVTAHTHNCPYCVDSFTNKALSQGITKEEMMEGVHVGASMLAGITLATSTQMRKIIKKKEM